MNINHNKIQDKFYNIILKLKLNCNCGLPFTKKKKNTTYTHNARGDYRFEFRSRTDIGMNESRFLFVLDVIVMNLLDEGRRTYSLYRMCVLSLIILLALRRTCFSYKAVTEVCLRPVILLLIFTTRCNLFLSFWLTFPNQHIKENVKTLYTRFVKHG